LTLFGTRPEIIKLAPVIRGLEARAPRLRSLNVCSGQHDDLLRPFLIGFGVRVDQNLRVMRPGQSLNALYARLLAAFDELLDRERPDLVLVQGDTTTALAGAQAAFHRGVPAGHVEAGLRSGDRNNPYPEELNRQLITRLATYHFAATAHNLERLRAEGVEPDRIYLTGNPVVDSLLMIRAQANLSPDLRRLIEASEGSRRIVLTTHRRENFGETMRGCLVALRGFVDRHQDVVLYFPVHPNPSVRSAASDVLAGHPRVHLLDPLNYPDFLALLSASWLIVSDSGGVQEEAPTLGKPLLILRDNTERPEAVESGIAQLVGADARRLKALLEESYASGSWMERIGPVRNPFGDGDAGSRIAAAIADILSVNATTD
jgi:UDP-N-acetylglucosamine 2-epimerase (non-hydrolysing)